MASPACGHTCQEPGPPEPSMCPHHMLVPVLIRGKLLRSLPQVMQGEVRSLPLPALLKRLLDDILIVFVAIAFMISLSMKRSEAIRWAYWYW